MHTNLNPLDHTFYPEHVECSADFSFDVLCSYAKDIVQKQLSLPSGVVFVGWQEIVFFLCENPYRWRFMGVSVNVLSTNGEPQEIVSSIFRHDPTSEIACPWPDVYAFCETSLQLPIGRVTPPFVRLYRQQDQSSRFYRLCKFDYLNLLWRQPVLPLAQPC